MTLNIIKNENGSEVMNTTLYLTTREEVMTVINKVTAYADKKKFEIVSKGLPIEEIKEETVKGFFSPEFQVLTSGNHIDITDGQTNIQFHFSPSMEIVSQPILAA